MCNCGKNSSTPPTGSKARASRNQAQEAADRAAKVAAARADNPSTTRIGAAATSVSQTFSLGDGLTFGSALERDAYLARNRA
jgi:hypothetical protein